MTPHLQGIPTVVAFASAVALVSSSPSALADHTGRTPAAVAPAPCISGERERRSESAVDDSEIRWTDETRYDVPREHALKPWQYSGSKIKLRPESSTTVNDLEFRDYRGSTGHHARVRRRLRPLRRHRHRHRHRPHPVHPRHR